MKIELDKTMKEIAEFLKDFPANIYFVGGCVRDILLNHNPHDYDLFTSLEPNEIQAWIKAHGRRPYLTGKRFGTIGFKHNDMIIEITTFRKETYDFKSRKPAVIFSKYVDEDIRRRDFTINAIACDLHGNVKDCVHGLEHLGNNILECVGNPKERFEEDPLRILRGIRLASKRAMIIEDKTYKKMIDCRFELLRLSKERIVEEMEKLFMLDAGFLSQGIGYYFRMNIFQIIFPELHLQNGFDQQNPNHKWMLDDHTMLVIEKIRKENTDAKMLWTGLFHDIAKPFTKVKAKNGEYYNYIGHERLGAEMTNKILLHYKFSNEKRKFIVDTILNHQEDSCWLKKYDDEAK